MELRHPDRLGIAAMGDVVSVELQLNPTGTLTLVSLEVCADTAVKGDWSGSGTSIIEVWGGVKREEWPEKRPMQIAVLKACSGKQEQSVPYAAGPINIEIIPATSFDISGRSCDCGGASARNLGCGGFSSLQHLNNLFALKTWKGPEVTFHPWTSILAEKKKYIFVVSSFVQAGPASSRVVLRCIHMYRLMCEIYS